MSTALTPDDREQLALLFDRAADLPPGEQAAFVARECGPNDALREELARLLQGLTGEDILDRLQVGAPLPPGTRIGPYELQQRIGQGGMGDVYSADQLEPIRRRVALKVIKAGMDSAQVVARFEAERQALARMDHPYVAQVFDGGATAEGRPYFVMEFVSGESITDYCDRHKLSTGDRLELFVRVCEGVQHAHLKGLIHRDLKPSNVLVMERDGRPVPKIIDFGVARATTGRLAERTLQTLVGQIVGTLEYMSPEQADPGGGDMDTRSDVYSLGVMLYQVVCGLLPFDHASSAMRSLAEIQRAIREEDPQTPSTRVRHEAGTETTVAPLHGTDERTLIRQLSGDLDWICLKALEKDPARRYQSASELAQDLRRHLAHEPVLAGRPGTLYRAGKFFRRHRVGVIAGSLVAIGLLTGIAGVISGQVRAAAKAEELLRLSDGSRLKQLLREADELWPAHNDPKYLRDLESWSRSATDLVSKLGSHQETLASLGADSFEERWQHEELTELVARLEALESGLIAPDALTLDHGWSIPKRVAFALDLKRRSEPGGDIHAAWQTALPLIHQIDLYRDLALTPQLGLLPLGPDPDSGLWEFAHLMSGVAALRVDGKLVFTPETGIVLVLLPSGEFLMGSQSLFPEEPNYFEQEVEMEQPLHRVSLEAFFISKYEATEAQWERFHGRNPSDGRHAPLKPVRIVSAIDCDRAAKRWGLKLPSEQEWEYAARGDEDAAWWTGKEMGSLQGAENVLDQSAMRKAAFAVRDGDAAPWNDGTPGLALVGSLRANPFGLHDVLGNVSEWTSSHPTYYRADGKPGQAAEHLRQARGGGFTSDPRHARSAFRGYRSSPGFVVSGLGVRFARSIDP